MQPNMQQSLSFIEVLTRNLFLLTVMCICIGVGVVVHLLNIESLSTYFIQIKSDRLDFIFFIGVAACYISLLFILIERYWVNFFTQLLTTVLLFILLVLVFNPSVKMNIYLFDFHKEFATRSWGKVKELPVEKIVTFNWLKMPDEEDQLFPHGVVCPASYSRYFLNFVFTTYEALPEETYRAQSGKVGIACNETTSYLMHRWPSREQALLAEDYQYFLKLDDNLLDESLYDKPLAISIDKLPMSLQKRIQQYNGEEKISSEKMMITSSFLRKVLVVKNRRVNNKRKLKTKR